MLWFLSLAAKARFAVARYSDRAVGVMTKNEHGKLWVSTVTLHPVVAFDSERRPDAAELDALHHRAHEECFIANSVRSEVRIDPPDVLS
jgi:organic hydroperoxide reductase OsmC/OhrA